METLIWTAESEWKLLGEQKDVRHHKESRLIQGCAPHGGWITPRQDNCPLVNPNLSTPGCAQPTLSGE